MDKDNSVIKWHMLLMLSLCLFRFMCPRAAKKLPDVLLAADAPDQGRLET